MGEPAGAEVSGRGEAAGVVDAQLIGVGRGRRTVVVAHVGVLHDWRQ